MKKNKGNVTVRSIIKLGNSRAITFPQAFIESFKKQEDKEKEEIVGEEESENRSEADKQPDEEDPWKDVRVYCYKIDNDSIIIKRQRAEEQKMTLKIDTKQVPLNLLTNILKSAKKLNINQVNITYDQNNDFEVLKIIDKFGVTPTYLSEKNIVTIQFLKDFSNVKLKDQISGMISNFVNLANEIFYLKEFDENKRGERTEIYVRAIEKNTRECIRMIISKLRNYYILDEQSESTNIINALGDRMLVSSIYNLALSIFGLKIYDDKELFKKYQEFIIKTTKMVYICFTELFLAEEKNYVKAAEEVRNELDSFIREYNNLRGQKDWLSLDLQEEAILTTLNRVANHLEEILDLLVTRWVELNAN